MDIHQEAHQFSIIKELATGEGILKEYLWPIARKVSRTYHVQPGGHHRLPALAYQSLVDQEGPSASLSGADNGPQPSAARTNHEDIRLYDPQAPHLSFGADSRLLL